MFRRPHNPAGFTLLEIVVAAAVTAMLMVALGGTLRVGFRANDAAYRATQRPREAELTLAVIEADLADALPPTGLLAGPFLGETLAGDDGDEADRIEFYTAVADPEDEGVGGDVKLVELVREVDADGNGWLARRVTRNLLASQTPEPREEVLCRGLARFDVWYWDGADWVETWDSTAQGDTLPQAVEVTLEWAASDDWPDGYRMVRVLGVPCATAPEGDVLMAAPMER